MNFHSLNAQITLENPSFEGEPKEAAVPNDWTACGLYSTPDILPGFWDVNKTPIDGNTFLGLITRDDNTWEHIGQRLSENLQPNECYTFRVFLARSPTYAGYNSPIKFKVWGGMDMCGKDQLLAQTEPIRHYDWKPYDFLLFPEKAYDYLIIEAYFVDGSEMPYRGNLMVDHLSSLMVCDRACLD